AVCEEAVLALDWDAFGTVFENIIRSADQLIAIRYEKLNSGASGIAIKHVVGRTENTASPFRGGSHEHAECDKHRAGDEECGHGRMLAKSAAHAMPPIPSTSRTSDSLAVNGEFRATCSGPALWAPSSVASEMPIS